MNRQKHEFSTQIFQCRGHYTGKESRRSLVTIPNSRPYFSEFPVSHRTLQFWDPAINSSNILRNNGVRRKRFRGVQGYGRPRRESGEGRIPRDAGKFAKKFLRKLQKNHFCIFSKKFNKICVNFSNALFYHIFQKDLTNHALNFCAFGRKTQNVGKF